MRFVRASGPLVGVEPELTPTEEHLSRARDLAARHPAVGLREVRLVQLDAPAFGRARAWLALESLQVTGSFKVRGALLAIERRLAEHRAAGASEPLVVITASAGNHGAGVARAARHLGVQAEIVVPRGAPRAKVDKIAAAGASVVEAKEAGYDAAEAEAVARAAARGVPFLSPYDDLDVVVGNGGSLALEIVRALGRVPDLVHCPIGGGGLAAGLASAFELERRRRGQGPPLGVLGGRRGVVVPVQSEASCAFATSIERGAAVTTLPPAETLAEGLEGGISERAYRRARAFIDDVIVCTEAEIEDAMRFAAREYGLLLEGSAAVALVPAMDGRSPFVAEIADGPAEADVVVVLTGRNVDAGRVARVLAG